MVFLNKYFTNIIHRQQFMKQQEIVKKIGVILKELQDQYQFIEQTQEPVNDLELELFVANGHFLTDHIEILRKVNEQALKTQTVKQVVKKSTISEKFFEPVIQPVRIAPEKKEAPVPYTEFETVDETAGQPQELELPAAVEPVIEPIATEEPAILLNEPVEEPVAEEAGISTPVSGPVEEPEEPAPPAPEQPLIKHELILDDIDYLDDDEEAVVNDEVNITDADTALRNIAERFGIPEFSAAKTEPAAHVEEPEAPAALPEPEPPAYIQPKPVVTVRATEDFNKPPLTLNQILSAQLVNATRLSEQLAPIKDLRAAINLNDKMLYVKDLFNGYSLSYSEAIELLNRMDSFDEADRFLKTNYAVKNSWSEKPATVDKFYALLKRRFA